MTRKKATRKKATRKKATRKKATRRKTKTLPGKRTRRRTVCKADCPAVVVSEIGRAVVVEYELEGRIHRHTFTGKSARVYATRDGSQLIVSPVRVRGGSIHG